MQPAERHARCAIDYKNNRCRDRSQINPTKIGKIKSHQTEHPEERSGGNSCNRYSQSYSNQLLTVIKGRLVFCQRRQAVKFRRKIDYFTRTVRICTSTSNEAITGAQSFAPARRNSINIAMCHVAFYRRECARFIK